MTAVKEVNTLNMLKKKISYKTSVIIFAALLLSVITAINFSFQAEQSGASSNNSKTAQLDDKESNQGSDMGTTVDKNSKSSENTFDSTQSDQQTDLNSTPIPPTSQPPASQPPGTEPPPPPASSGQTVTVTINSSGNYSPLNLTLNKGDTIRWVNNDNKKHWPASDPHPQHTNYSGFDSLGITLGKSWSFTFSSQGSWGWHDHQFPSTTGTITVL